MPHSFLLPQRWNLPLLPVNRGAGMQVDTCDIMCKLWIDRVLVPSDAARDLLVKDVNSRRP